MRFLVGSGDSHPFQGEVSGDRFKLVRVIGYRNSFLPVVRRRVSRDNDGHTTISVWMTLNPAAALFMAAWFAIVLSGLIPEIVSDEVSLPSVGMLLFGIILIGAGFFPEVVRTERILRTALGADER